MTELATVATSNSEHDILDKSSGSLCPATRAKIIGLDGNEVTGLDTPGELWIQSPSATLGYLNNQKATAETFVYDEDGRWVRTGDEALVTKAPSGNEHVVIVDRIKELIKVKGTFEPFDPTSRHGSSISPIPQPKTRATPGLTPQKKTTRPPSRPGRAGSAPPLAPGRRRLRRHPGPRRPRGRGPQGLCRQVGRRRRGGPVRRRGRPRPPEARRGAQGALQVDQGRRRVPRRRAQEPQRQDPAAPAARPGQGRPGQEGAEAVKLRKAVGRRTWGLVYFPRPPPPLLDIVRAGGKRLSSLASRGTCTTAIIGPRIHTALCV